MGAYLIKGLIKYVNDTYIFINPYVDYHDNKHLYYSNNKNKVPLQI